MRPWLLRLSLLAVMFVGRNVGFPDALNKRAMSSAPPFGASERGAARLPADTAATIVSATPHHPPLFQVQGIVQTGDSGYAVVRNSKARISQYVVGDNVEDGWRVRRIEPTFVVVVRDGEAISLRPEGRPAGLAGPAPAAPVSLPGFASSVTGPVAIGISDDQGRENNRHFLEAVRSHMIR
jgi:hypothetical protein